MWGRLILLFAILIAGCKDFDAPTEDSAIPEATNISIDDLHTMVGNRTIYIDQDIIIGGYVTSSDKAENFYKSFTIEDATGGTEIMAGLYDTHNIYPIGTYVTVHLAGCAIGEHYGVMQVGLPAASYSTFPTEYFASQVLLDKHLRRYDIVRPTAPLPLTLRSIQKSHCGELVSIGPLTHNADESASLWEGNSDGRWSGYNIFEDDNGDRVAVYTSEYANYADNKIPSGKIALIGIVQYGKVGGKEYFMIKMRDEKDCTMVN